MSDIERNELLAIMDQAAKETEALSPEEAMQKLVDEGFYTSDGKLTEKYGGKAS